MSNRYVHATTRAGAALLRVRWLIRAPIWFYRARLGFLLGARFLMLEHIGRKTGRPRFVVLEVIDHPSPDRYLVISGFGESAQWFRNVIANDHVRVYRGARNPRPARAHRLDPAAAAEAMSRYATAHPRAWSKLRPVLEQALGSRIDESGTTLPIVALDILAETPDTP